MRKKTRFRIWKQAIYKKPDPELDRVSSKQARGGNFFAMIGLAKENGASDGGQKAIRNWRRNHESRVQEEGRRGYKAADEVVREPGFFKRLSTDNEPIDVDGDTTSESVKQDSDLYF